MKEYIAYMDGITAPDTLRQRLLSLEAPQKRPAAWKRYGTLAAVLLLVVGGAGAWRVSQYFRTFTPTALESNDPGRPDANAEPGTPDVDIPEIADAAQPDIALAEPGDIVEPGPKTYGGYEVVYGSGPDAIVSYHVLPYIEYGEAEGAVAADWDLPYGATRRVLTQDEIIALMGGADAVSDHLDWGEYQLSGWAAWYADGSFWGAFIDGLLIYYGGPANQFEFAVTANQLPPTCFGYPNSVTQEIRGLTVTADKYDWELAEPLSYNISERRVSFMKDSFGYRFEMSSGRVDAAEEMVSRLVARIADKGLDLDTLTSDGAELAHPWEDPNYAEPDYFCDCPDCADGTVHTHPYNPQEALDPSYDAPVVEEDDPWPWPGD